MTSFDALPKVYKAAVTDHAIERFKQRTGFAGTDNEARKLLLQPSVVAALESGAVKLTNFYGLDYIADKGAIVTVYPSGGEP